MSAEPEAAQLGKPRRTYGKKRRTHAEVRRDELQTGWDAVVSKVSAWCDDDDGDGAPELPEEMREDVAASAAKLARLLDKYAKRTGTNGAGNPYNKDEDDDQEDAEVEELPRPVPWAEFFERPSVPPEWVIPGFVQAGAQVTFSGPPGAGKTALAIKLTAEAVKAGKRVLFVELEGSEFALKHKLRFSGLEPKTAGLDILYGSRIDLASEEWKAHLENLAEGRDFLVLDTLADVWSGNLLDVEKLGEFLKWLRAMCRGLGAACILVTHVPKAVANSAAAPALADVFGSQVLGGKIDSAFIVRNFKSKSAKGKDAAEEEEAADKPLKEVHCVKMRDAEFPESRTGRILVLQVGDLVKTDGKPVTVGIWEWVGKSPQRLKAERVEAKVRDCILETLRVLDAPPNRTALYKAAKDDDRRPGKAVFLQVLERMVANGDLTEDDGLRSTLPAAPNSAGTEKGARTPRSKRQKAGKF
ncbi:MAG: AAA family ATPase [Myxococcaceae bacterium]